MYYKELVYVIMEDGKSQCLQGELASWRHRRINDSVPKALRSKTQEETMSWVKSKGREHFLVSGRGLFLVFGRGFSCVWERLFLGFGRGLLVFGLFALFRPSNH